MHIETSPDTNASVSVAAAQTRMVASASVDTAGLGEMRRSDPPGGALRSFTPPVSWPEDPDHPFHDHVHIVTCCGRICFERRKINLSTVFAGQKHVNGTDRGELERVMGIEPTLVAWEATVLPLNYTRARPRFYAASAVAANRGPDLASRVVADG